MYPIKLQDYQDVWMLKNVKECFESISLTYLKPSHAPVSSEAEPEVICSYNWIESKDPKIYVPGGPAVWRNLQLPVAIPEDSGEHFIDQNGARVPEYPFEAVFRATEVMQPDYSFANIDVLINRNSLRKFLDICTWHRADKVFSFRVNLYTIGKTLVVERCEKETKEMIRGAGDPGYGHSFEQNFTGFPAELRDSAGHHRVLKYEFGGLQLAVRSEVDAQYDESASDTLLVEALTNTASTNTTSRDDATNLIDLFGSLELTPERNAATDKLANTGTSSVSVMSCGTLTPQSKTAEVKTCQKSFRPEWKLMPQLWFGRTPYLIQGRHENGTFEEVKILQAGRGFESWESDHRTQAALRKVASLLVELREAIRGSDVSSGMAIFERRAPTVIKICSPLVDTKPLPDDVIGKFWMPKYEET